MTSIKFTVKWGKETIDLELPPSATVGDLRGALQQRTNVPPAMQKLMFKGQMKDDTKNLTECGLKEGSKMMMMGSSVQDVVTVNTAADQADIYVPQMKQRAAVWAEPMWRGHTYAAIFADALVEGSNLASGHMAESMRVLHTLLTRISTIQFNEKMLQLEAPPATSSIPPPALTHSLPGSWNIHQEQKAKGAGLATPGGLNGAQGEGTHHNMLSTFEEQHYQILADGQRLLKACLDITHVAAQAKAPEDIKSVIQEWVERVGNLSEGAIMLAPGGWWGMAQAGVVLHIIERTGPDRYAFVTCNSGSGIEYHPSCAADSPTTPPKIKYKTCLRIEDIPGGRMRDVGFWTIMFSLWMKPNDPQKMSEYNRVEVLYDVLLPWLAEAPASDPAGLRLLTQAFADTRGDPYAEWRTPGRSGSSSTRSLLEGLRYMYRHLGLSSAQVKQLSYVLRWELLVHTGEVPTPSLHTLFRLSLPDPYASLSLTPPQL